MKTKSWAVLAAALSLGTASQAAVVLSESFDDVAALAGWVQDNSGGAGSGWFQGNEAIFPAFSGAPGSYAAANFADTVPSVADWLITPELVFSDITQVSLRVRAAGDDFLDTLDVFLSTAGSSTALGDFSTLLGSYASSVDEGWVELNLGFVGAGNGRIGLRYTIADTAVDGNYLGVDDLEVRTEARAVPVPATAALSALGLLALAAATRRRA